MSQCSTNPTPPEVLPPAISPDFSSSGLERFAQSVIGTPFVAKGRDRVGLDCWGVIVLAYRELLGVELPGYESDYEHTTSVECGAVARAHVGEGWRPVERP